MWVTGSSLLFVVFTCWIGVESSPYIEQWRMLEIECERSKIVVEPTRNTTFFKIVTHNGNTLFTVDNSNTEMKDLNDFGTTLSSIFYPEPGHFLQGNSSNFYIVKKPIDYGLEVKLVNGSNTTVFHKVIKGSNEGLKKTDVKCAHLTGMKLSIEPGLDVNHRDGYNMTLLLWAAMLGEEEIGKDLVNKGADVNTVAVFGFTPLICAIVMGQERLVEYLIKHGAPVGGHYGFGGISPIHFAGFKGRAKCAQILLENGADINSRTAFGNFTPLHFAILESHPDVVKLLIEKGADVNANIKTGYTPLHAAVIVRNEQLIHILLEAGADINGQNDFNETALILAVKRRTSDGQSLKIIQHFIEHHKPDVNIKDWIGKTALSYATEKGFSQVQSYLKQHGAS